ncbi:hypothetical protein O181_026668 [Austropuccinia psidii MF-1]|uniref:Uncharacterized protein n=1 Tax=Austropuccinia psidii MF-1 TaxID=1389203 RepID=A0A9Q3H074_9BASI|nr:hypothetical protein [Austropuccinia psidii MF-1]
MLIVYSFFFQFVVYSSHHPSDYRQPHTVHLVGLGKLAGHPFWILGWDARPVTGSSRDLGSSSSGFPGDMLKQPCGDVVHRLARPEINFWESLHIDSYRFQLCTPRPPLLLVSFLAPWLADDKISSIAAGAAEVSPRLTLPPITAISPDAARLAEKTVTRGYDLSVFSPPDHN